MSNAEGFKVERAEVLHERKPPRVTSGHRGVPFAEILAQREAEGRLGEDVKWSSAAMTAGAIVRAMRKNAGLTQRELAASLGVTQERVSTIERGEGRHGPSFEVLTQIANMCGMEIVFAPRGEVARSLAATRASAGRSGVGIAETTMETVRAASAGIFAGAALVAAGTAWALLSRRSSVDPADSGTLTTDAAEWTISAPSMRGSAIWQSGSDNIEAVGRAEQEAEPVGSSSAYATSAF